MELHTCNRITAKEALETSQKHFNVRELEKMLEKCYSGIREAAQYSSKTAHVTFDSYHYRVMANLIRVLEEDGYSVKLTGLVLHTTWSSPR